MADDKKRELERKEKLKQLRRERYKKAKEEFENSSYGKLMKEKEKLLRQKSYLLAKKKRAQWLEEQQRKQKERTDPPKLVLIKNPDWEE